MLEQVGVTEDVNRVFLGGPMMGQAGAMGAPSAAPAAAAPPSVAALPLQCPRRASAGCARAARSAGQKLAIAAFEKTLSTVYNDPVALAGLAELIKAKIEVLRLRAQLRSAEEEREILKKAARYFARESE